MLLELRANLRALAAELAHRRRDLVPGEVLAVVRVRQLSKLPAHQLGLAGGKVLTSTLSGGTSPPASEELHMTASPSPECVAALAYRSPKRRVPSRGSCRFGESIASLTVLLTQKKLLAPLRMLFGC